MLKVITVTNPFIRCRTCFAQTNGEVYTRISNVCYLNKSVKEVITMLVPQMGKTLDDEDFTCKNCFEILKNCMIFIEKCLEVERKIKANRQILSLYSNESEVNAGAATIKGPEKTSQTLLNIYANLRGDSTFEKSEQEMGGLVPLVPQFSGNNAPVEKPKINCNVNLLPNLENTTNVAHVSTNEDNLQNYCTQAELLNGKDHNRVLTLEQPSGKVVLDFISYLLQSEIKVLQISKNPESTTSSTKKRILLLGKTNTLKCSKCLKYFESIKIYNKHIIKCLGRCQQKQKVKAPRPRVCRLCDKKIEAHQMKLHRRQHELEQLRERRQKKLKKIKLQCQTCSERFTSKEDYELHLEFHPPHICKQCGKGFIRKISLQAHKNIHNAPNSFICEICGKGYKDRSSLRCHLNEHQHKMLKCDKCSKSFKTNLRLRKHVRSVHDRKEKFQCNQCGILITTKSYLDVHIRLTHLKMKPFKCKICGREFGRADYLQNHVKIHTGELLTQQRSRIENNGKQLTCKFCGKSTKNINNMKKHLKTHIKTRRYPCQFCPLTFADEQLRKRHELIHQNVDNIVRCNICYKRFKTKEEVDEHITTHKNPQHACDTCGQLFHRKYLLDHHNSQEHMTADDFEKREEMLHKSLLESIGADG